MRHYTLTSQLADHLANEEKKCNRFWLQNREEGMAGKDITLTQFLLKVH